MGIVRILNNDDLLKAINCYIIKADEDLEEEFKENGIVEPMAAVALVNAIEDGIIDVEENIVNTLMENYKSNDTVNDTVFSDIKHTIQNTEFEIQYADMLHDSFAEMFESSVEACSKEIDKDIVITEYTMKSKDWLAEWAHQLAEILKTQNEDAVIKILESCNDSKSTIKDTQRLIVDLGIRGEGNSSRRLAITETYRVNNYAKEEAFIQNPSVTGKEWVHSGSRKNARKYHLALDGVVIPVSERFNLKGVKGGTHHPMIPHDTSLPVEEVANCKCKIEYRTSKEILNKNADEKAKEQKKRVRESDIEWEKEFNERNKKASGIDFEKVKIDWIKKKSPDEQIKYFGGNHSGKARKALIDSGVIKTDKDLQQLYKRSNSGKRQLKTLKELEDGGIITVRKTMLEHTTKGEFTGLKNPKKPRGGPNGGKPKGGFHSESSIKELNNIGLKVHIEKVYPNGVRLGSIDEHKSELKKYKEGKKVIGQSWFPKDWSDDDILEAGTYVLNTYKVDDDGITYRGKYKNVKIVVVNNKPGTIYPDSNQ